MTLTIDEMATFCKKKGFVYPNSEIYGGMAGFFDYGPLGVEMKNNIKANWWKYHVQDRDDVVDRCRQHPHQVGSRARKGLVAQRDIACCTGR